MIANIKGEEFETFIYSYSNGIDFQDKIKAINKSLEFISEIIQIPQIQWIERQGNAAHNGTYSNGTKIRSQYTNWGELCISRGHNLLWSGNDRGSSVDDEDVFLNSPGGQKFLIAGYLQIYPMTHFHVDKKLAGHDASNRIPLNNRDLKIFSPEEVILDAIKEFPKTFVWVDPILAEISARRK
jgi:hypothetical protein